MPTPGKGGFARSGDPIRNVPLERKGSEDRSMGYYRCKVRLWYGETHVEIEATGYQTLEEVLSISKSLAPHPAP